MPDRVKLAFVGCGNCLTVSFGPVLPFIDGLDVVAAVDPSATALALACDTYGITAGYTTLEECLEKESIDAALIAAPVFMHQDLAITCAKKGIHVLLEKPMARNLSECEAIISAHESADTILMMAFMKRFNRTMLAVDTLLSNGAIGQVMGIRHNWDWGGNEQASFADQWRGRRETLGGQWQDHGSHSVDLAHWWAGPIRSVMATFDITEPNYDVENEYNVICTHQSGVRSVHQSTKFLHRENEEHYEIFGETGSIELRHASGVWQHTTPYEAYLHRYGRTRENISPSFSRNWLEEGRIFGQYKVELDHFTSCVRKGNRPTTDGPSGRAVMEVICAAYLSAIEHREINLPLTKDVDSSILFDSIEPRIPPRYRNQARR
ncbi:MAG: Gfo/Idh/MocA family oxidoreductase [Candidatus Latescibacteria bacterium]|nr:Gfo/Idh/MocA family oxidoreductase [Candidatus Latescibacterota bacterium]